MLTAARAATGIEFYGMVLLLAAGFGVAPSTLKHQAGEAKKQPATAH